MIDKTIMTSTINAILALERAGVLKLAELFSRFLARVETFFKLFRNLLVQILSSTVSLIFVNTKFEPCKAPFSLITISVHRHATVVPFFISQYSYKLFMSFHFTKH